MNSDLKRQHLHFDCVSGIAGDMALGAFIDLGVPASVIIEAVSAVGLGEDRLRIESVIKSGIASTNVWVRCEEGQLETHGHNSEHVHEHTHEHEHGDHHHHHYAEIRRNIQAAKLAPGVIEISLRIFDCLAVAEAKLHGMTVEEVAFHEVGAVDSIVDVVGSAAAMHWLDPVSVSCGPVAMGRGSIRCAHGILPVPAPAAIEVLRVAKAPVEDGGIDKELCTPTGAALLAAIVTDWGQVPTMVPLSIGYGAGDLDLPDRPNVLRATIGEKVAKTADSADSIVEVSTNIDDMNPELCEHVAKQLFATGAIDVWWTAITMKKGRPALALQAMVKPECLDAVLLSLFRESSSIGVRISHKHRRILERETVVVETKYGSVPLKIARYRGELVNSAPEYEACQEIATTQSVPLKEVFAETLSCWHASRTPVTSVTPVTPVTPVTR